jgi:two-component system, NarL family, sensor histidine kinase UhpB
MTQKLRVLIIEDSRDDTELLLRELRQSGFDVSWERAYSAETMSAALDRGPWDIVLADYVMPSFGGLEALEIFKQRGLDVPFIVVSGHIGEDIAVAAIHGGANDYVMKDRLARLGPAVRRALEEADTRRARLQSQMALRDSEERFRQLAENIGAVFFMHEWINGDPTSRISYVSPAFEHIWGYPGRLLAEEPGRWLESIHREDRGRVMQNLPRLARGEFNEEFRIQSASSTRWVLYRSFPVRDERGTIYRVAAIAEDITERKCSEAQLAENARHLQQMVQELQSVKAALENRNEDLSRARANLERRVRERTVDLTTANSALQAQINERKRLENELLEIAENERRRIGFDLHDDLGQKLMGVSWLLKAMENRLTARHSREAAETRKVQSLVNQVISRTHDLAHCFSSFDVEADDLPRLLRRLIRNVRKAFHVTCHVMIPNAMPELSEEETVQLYKIVQEAVSNAIKHGKATRIDIRIVSEGGSIVLTVKNDGLPFPVRDEPTTRMGLRIMQYRASTIGATLDIRANGSSGTLLECVLPAATHATPVRSERIAPVSEAGKPRPASELVSCPR